MQEFTRPQKKPRGYGEEVTGILNLLPDDLLAYVAQFLNIYEQVGLGRVSHRFRRVIYSAIKYEPFSYDAYNSNGKLWAVIGMQDRFGNNYTSGSYNTRLNELAARAYGSITRAIEGIAGSSDRGRPCSLLLDISQKTTQNAKPFIAVNCVATLTVGTESVFAVNFIADGYESLQLEMEKHSIREAGINYRMVTHRHAECRFMVKLMLGDPIGATIDIDKLCCVFCAAQFCALGCHDMMPGWRKGKLGWYTFMPVVMFFGKHRRKMWGEAIDEEYRALSLDDKLLFLYHLVCQTQVTTTPTVTSVPSLAVAPKVKGTMGRCETCGSLKQIKKGPYGAFWGCPTYWKHKRK